MTAQLCGGIRSRQSLIARNPITGGIAHPYSQMAFADVCMYDLRVPGITPNPLGMSNGHTSAVVRKPG